MLFNLYKAIQETWVCIYGPERPELSARRSKCQMVLCFSAQGHQCTCYGVAVGPAQATFACAWTFACGTHLTCWTLAACVLTVDCMRCAGDLYQRLDVRLTGMARGTAPHTPDGALAALHLADLALWLAPRAPFARELHVHLPSTPAPSSTGAATPLPGQGKVGICTACAP